MSAQEGVKPWPRQSYRLTTVNYYPFCVPAADRGPSGGQVGVISPCQVTKPACVLHTAVFSQAGESLLSAPQLSGLKNETGREIYKPVLKKPVCRLLIQSPPPGKALLGSPTPFSFILQRWWERKGELNTLP